MPSIARHTPTIPQLSLHAALSPAHSLRRMRERLGLWRRRARERAALAQLDTQALHDIGLSSADARYEASKKFWQA